MKLRDTELVLGYLKRYLCRKSKKLRHLSKLSVVHDKSADVRNREKARQFCHVYPDSYVIHCSKAIEYVSDEVMVGLLLHEIGHIELQAFHDRDHVPDECEVHVDEWVMRTFPESGYHFADHRYGRIRGRLGGNRTAKSVQHVSRAFVNLLAMEDSVYGR